MGGMGVAGIEEGTVFPSTGIISQFTLDKGESRIESTSKGEKSQYESNRVLSWSANSEDNPLDWRLNAFRRRDSIYDDE